MDGKTDAAVAPTAGWRAIWPASAGRDIIGGFNAAMIGLPYTIGLGIVAFAPLGPAFAAEGALAGVLGSVCVGFLVPLFGGTKAMISGPRVTTALVLSLLAQVVVDDPRWKDLEWYAGDLGAVQVPVAYTAEAVVAA